MSPAATGIPETRHAQAKGRGPTRGEGEFVRADAEASSETLPGVVERRARPSGGGVQSVRVAPPRRIHVAQNRCGSWVEPGRRRVKQPRPGTAI